MILLTNRYQDDPFHGWDGLKPKLDILHASPQRGV